MAETFSCKQCGAEGSQLIGHRVQGFFDGVAFWSCTSCGSAWPRDFGDSRRREQATLFVEGYLRNVVADQLRLENAELREQLAKLAETD